MIKWQLNTIQFIFEYPNYVELVRDKEKIVSEIKSSKLCEVFKGIEVLPPLTEAVSSMIPFIEIRLFEDEEKKSIPAVQIMIDPSSLRIIFFGKNQTLEDFLIYEQFNNYIDLASDFWNYFNSVASRGFILRLGLVTIFHTEVEIFEELKKRLLKVEIHPVCEIRYSKFIKDESGIFKNTTIVPNLFVSPLVVPDNFGDESSIPRVRQVRLISDIATTPSSKGIISLNRVKEGFDKFFSLSREQLKLFREEVQG